MPKPTSRRAGSAMRLAVHLDLAENALRAIHDILWPADDPDRDWSADELDAVAHVVDGYFPGLFTAKKKKGAAR